MSALLLAAAADPAFGQELAGPTADLVIAWRSPQSATMPTVTWTIGAAERQTSLVRTEARALFDRLATEATMYRVVFPMLSVDQFGSRFEFAYDKSAIEAIGRLDDRKSARVAVKIVSTFMQPQTKQVVRNEHSGASVLTVEKRETVAIPAGRFETIVLRLEGENAPGTPAGHRVYRRYWYAPALGWYVQHELVLTGPQINQRNFYVATKITRAAKSAERQ